MRYYTGKKNLITLLICLIFCIFVFGYETHTRNSAETRIQQHALVIADALWNANIDSAAEYLRLAVATNSYSSLTVYEQSGMVFQSISSTPTARLKKLLISAHLTPEIQLAAQVLHHGNKIGSIKAIWLPSTIFTHIKVLFILTIITATLHLYIRTNMDKAILEERVRSRTEELAQSNRTLLREIHQKKKTSSILRKSEEEYRELYRESKSAEEVYRSLIDSSADAILICDLHQKVDYLSSTFTNLFGWTLEDVTGKSIGFFTPEEQKEAADIFSDIRDNGASYQSYETRAITKDGQYLDISLSGSRYNDHTDNPKGILFVIRDISYRKKMEKQLQRAERMEAVGTLAGGIAHDFNNLLMGIQGNTSLALLETSPHSPILNRLQNIEAYVDSGQELTAQLLGFARGGKYEVKSTDINQLLTTETRLFGRTRKDISFREEYQEDIWPVAVDRGQIRQVLLNLYVNASHAMSGGGTIQVSTLNADIDGVPCGIYEIPQGRYIKICVTDSGHGMDRQTMTRIFDPFFTTKEIGRGTGLGLASAYGIIKNHKGFIDVYSEPGQGTTFTIYLPALVAGSHAERDEKAHDASELKPGQGKILLVDDEMMILEVGREMLKAVGYEVISANCGREACRIYSQQKDEIAAVILDMIMPEMDGGAVFEQLKTMNPDVKVLLSSGYSLNDKAAGIMAQGCSGFLQKPFDIIMLSSKLQVILTPANESP
jgi:PAS domain S-box-containing protein